MEIGNSSFEWMEAFRYLGTTLTDQNSIVDKIKSRLKSGNVCWHLSSSLLSKYLNINVYKSIIFPVVLYGCQSCHSH